jgi:hypothetical protein
MKEYGICIFFGAIAGVIGSILIEKDIIKDNGRLLSGVAGFGLSSGFFGAFSLPLLYISYNPLLLLKEVLLDPIFLFLLIFAGIVGAIGGTIFGMFFGIFYGIISRYLNKSFNMALGLLLGGLSGGISFWLLSIINSPAD